MRGIATCAAATLLAAEALVAGQGRTAEQVLAEARQALGGDKLAAVRTVTGSGRTLRAAQNGTTVENDFELALELPDKYRMRSVLAAMGNMSIYRHSGFNGGQVIDEIDRPPNLAGGGVVIRAGGPGGATDLDKMTPDQRAEADRARLSANKMEFARLALGLLAGSTPAFPVEFSYAGEAEAPDGKADVLDVKGDGGFAARLFIDQATHRPLMLTWQDREPLVVRMNGPQEGSGARGTAVAGGAVMYSGTSGDMATMRDELEARRREAEARRRVVEYRLYYGDYRATGGVTWPHRLQRSIDGKPSEELVFDSLKINPRIDAKLFQVSK